MKIVSRGILNQGQSGTNRAVATFPTLTRLADGSLLAYFGHDKKLTVVATGTWEPVKVLEVEADGGVAPCAFSPDGSLLLLDRRSFSVSFFSFRLRGSRLVVVGVTPSHLAPKRCTQGVVALPVLSLIHI